MLKYVSPLRMSANWPAVIAKVPVNGELCPGVSRLIITGAFVPGPAGP
jgi:hypothetical protein